jgi:opacity protein-like surface antigen
MYSFLRAKISRHRRRYLGANRTLFYVTGGLAATSWEFQQALSEAAISSELASDSKTKLGWTIGAGVECALISS